MLTAVFITRAMLTAVFLVKEVLTVVFLARDVPTVTPTPDDWLPSCTTTSGAYR